MHTARFANLQTGEPQELKASGPNCIPFSVSHICILGDKRPKTRWVSCKHACRAGGSGHKQDSSQHITRTEFCVLLQKSVVDQAEKAFKEQVDEIDKTIKQPLQEGQAATSPDNTW